MTETSADLRLLDFVQVVLERPLIYTMTGAYNEVVAFIEGYHVGHRPTGTEWINFMDGLRESLGAGDGRLLVRFRRNFSDDATALQTLHGLYNAFLQHQQNET